MHMDTIVRCLFGIIFLLLGIMIYLVLTSVQFGLPFPHPLMSLNVGSDCVFNEIPVCCLLGESSDPEATKETIERAKINWVSSVVPQVPGADCTTRRRYIASAYETNHLNTAIALASIKDEKKRRDSLLDYMYKDLEHANRWLERVRIRMNLTSPPEATVDDLQYMSHYEVTRTCAIHKMSTHTAIEYSRNEGGSDGPTSSMNNVNSAEFTTTVDKWNEWIEPITVAMRHPFSFRGCYNGAAPKPYWVDEFKKRRKEMKFHVGLIAVDHILIQSGYNVRSTRNQGQVLTTSADKHSAGGGTDAGSTSTTVSSLPVGNNSKPRDNRHKMKHPSQHHYDVHQSIHRQRAVESNKNHNHDNKNKNDHRYHRIHDKLPVPVDTVAARTGTGNRLLTETEKQQSLESSIPPPPPPPPPPYLPNNRPQKLPWRPPMNFIFDVGTSTFETSMLWFVCAYLQQEIAYDKMLAWEFTPLEPEYFWKRVPPELLPNYQFYNTKISANITDHNSLLRIIQQITRPEDFVSVKLDIDTPETEIPIVQQILANPNISGLIDEFFFELHFRCEILMYCGWTDTMPEQYDGLTLDRPNAMKLFQDLRAAGIRAHVWP